MSMYTLTHLTGRKRNEGRVTVVQGFEFQRKTLFVIGVSTAVSIVPSMILSLTVSPFFLLIIPAVTTIGSYWFFVTRSREGMKLSRYRTITDRKKANLNEFHICFQPISSLPTGGIIQRQTVNVLTEEQERDEAIPAVIRPRTQRDPRSTQRSVLSPEVTSA